MGRKQKKMSRSSQTRWCHIIDQAQWENQLREYYHEIQDIEKKDWASTIQRHYEDEKDCDERARQQYHALVKSRNSTRAERANALFPTKDREPRKATRRDLMGEKVKPQNGDNGDSTDERDNPTLRRLKRKMQRRKK